MPDSDPLEIQKQNSTLAKQVLDQLSIQLVTDAAFNFTPTMLDGLSFVKDVFNNPPANLLDASDYLANDLIIDDIQNIQWVGGLQVGSEFYASRSFQSTYLVPTTDEELVPKKWVEDNFTPL